jgi:hypothetical protein
VLLPQNAFFNPFLLKAPNNNVLFIYFSGAGSSEGNLCERNWVKSINISELSLEHSDTPLQFEQKIRNIFNPLPDSIVCDSGITYHIFHQTFYLTSSSLFDYASVLLKEGELSYFLIHSGCPCYLSQITKHTFLIIIQDFEFTYMEIKQNIPIA